MNRRPAADTLPALLALVALLSACTSVRSIPLGESAYPARPGDHPVAVYHGLDDLPRPYVKVARIRVCVDRLSTASEVELLREAARRAGGDALALLETPICHCEEGGNDVRETAVAVRWR